MIQWFDADKFLPGRETDYVLVRVIDYMCNVTTAWFDVAEYHNGQWMKGDSKLNNDNSSVTHWAFIEGPT
jgi:hypothetical protein